jgi:ABC-type multidrug transport system fused ATPase/permease subunit
MKPTVENQPQRYSQSTILLRCFGYLRPHWKLVTGIYITMVLIDLIAMVNPQVLRWTIDNGIGKGNDSLLTLVVGELGKALVKRIHADHPEARILLIDLRPGLLTEAGLSGDNVISVQSDMTSIETLKKGNCHKARLVLLASGNDAFNLEAAYKIHQLNPQTETWVRLHHSGLADLMDLSRKPNLHFFSPYQQAADAIAGHLLQEEKINK